MKAVIIKAKLKKYHYPESDTILLEILKGKPRSPEGGEWIEAKVEDIEALTEAVDFPPAKSGWGKYLDKWHEEGLITAKEKNTGKS